MLGLHMGFQPPNSTSMMGCSLNTCAECPAPLALEIGACSISAALPRAAEEKGTQTCCFSMFHCPGVFNARSNAEDEPGEAGEMQNSCGSRFLLFTQLPSILPPSQFAPHVLQISPAETDGYRQGFVFDAVACCKCCTVLFLLFFNQQIVIYAYARKKKRPRHKLYQNCPEWFGCFVIEFAVGNDVVDRQSYSWSSSM